MPRLENSILIRASVPVVFNLTNDITRWPQIFREYEGARVLDTLRSGQFTALNFELSNATTSWRSWRLLDHSNYFAIAERCAPLFPFAFMHLRWNYEMTGQGTTMTWIQDFELDPEFDTPLETVLKNMIAHTRENQQHVKDLIESLPDSPETSDVGLNRNP